MASDRSMSDESLAGEAAEERPPPIIGVLSEQGHQLLPEEPSAFDADSGELARMRAFVERRQAEINEARQAEAEARVNLAAVRRKHQGEAKRLKREVLLERQRFEDDASDAYRLEMAEVVTQQGAFYEKQFHRIVQQARTTQANLQEALLRTHEQELDEALGAQQDFYERQFARMHQSKAVLLRQLAEALEREKAAMTATHLARFSVDTTAADQARQLERQRGMPQRQLVGHQQLHEDPPAGVQSFEACASHAATAKREATVADARADARPAALHAEGRADDPMAGGPEASVHCDRCGRSWPRRHRLRSEHFAPYDPDGVACSGHGGDALPSAEREHDQREHDLQMARASGLEEKFQQLEEKFQQLLEKGTCTTQEQHEEDGKSSSAETGVASSLPGEVDYGTQLERMARLEDKFQILLEKGILVKQRQSQEFARRAERTQTLERENEQLKRRLYEVWDLAKHIALRRADTDALTEGESEAGSPDAPLTGGHRAVGGASAWSFGGERPRKDAGGWPPNGCHGEGGVGRTASQRRHREVSMLNVAHLTFGELLEELVRSKGAELAAQRKAEEIPALVARIAELEVELDVRENTKSPLAPASLDEHGSPDGPGPL